jgi:hypothetical protein
METRRTFLRLIPAAAITVRGVAFASDLSAHQVAFHPDQMAGSPEGSPLPGQPWKVHDRSRPQARKVTPGLPLCSPLAPADATVLFDGKDLSQWSCRDREGRLSEKEWKVVGGSLEMVPGTNLVSTDRFGDCQLHLEWMTPAGVDASHYGQMRGNSGVILMGHYEIQILSSFDNITYADGAAGGIYGLYPPLVNPCRPEGEWNTYDIVFKAPVFKGLDVVSPGYITLFFNGLLAHDHVELLGVTDVLPIAKYQPHPAEESLVLQGHVGPARFRNIWIRKLKGYDS